MRHQVVVDRIGLHHDDLALDEELGEDIAGPERRHIARGQDERRAGMGDGVGVGRRLAGDQDLPGDARLHPDLGRRLGERDPVEGAGREDLDPQPTVRRLAHGPGEGGLAVLGDVAQRVAQQARHAHERPDAGETAPHPPRCVPGASPLASQAAASHSSCGGHGVGDHLLQQIGPGGGAGPGPRGGAGGDVVDDCVERGRVERVATPPASPAPVPA